MIYCIIEKILFIYYIALGGIFMIENKNRNEDFIPALKFKRLTGFFDTFLKVFMNEDKIKRDFIEIVQIKDYDKILDFGCGTGTLLQILSTRHPNNKFIGVDIDKNVLELAKKKLMQNNTEIVLDIYDGLRMPYEDNYFDKILSSLVIHHISTENKPLIFREIQRTLKPGGEIFIMDLGKQKGLYPQLVTFVLKKFEPINDNIHGLIPLFLREAKFENIYQMKEYKTWFGNLTIYHGSKDK